MKDGFSQNLSNSHWIWFWSGNWPLLDALFERDLAYEKEFHKIAGIAPQIAVDFYQKGIITAYHAQEEYERLETFFLRKFRSSPAFINKSFRSFAKRTSADIESLKEIAKFPLKTLTNKELAKLFLKSRMHFRFVGAIDHYAWYIEKFFIPLLQNFLESKLKKNPRKIKIAEMLITLTTPHRPSRIYRERKAFFHIAKQIKRNKLLVKDIRKGTPLTEIVNRYPKISNLFQAHLKKFCWLPVLVNNSPTTLQGLWFDITNQLHTNKPSVVETKRLGDNFNQSSIAKSKLLVKTLKPSKNIRELISGLQTTAFIRTEDNAVISRSSYLIRPLLQEIAKRIRISYHDLKNLMPDEIIQSLRGSGPVSKRFISQRKKLTCYIAFRGRRSVLTGRKAKIILDMVLGQHKILKNDTDVFTGSPASVGKVKGTARVVFSSKDALNIKAGEILIAPATSADFAPAMRKAAAIVTEFGGLTSHAAVVSREFNIPCVVGVPQITQKIKNGEMVEVNGNTGIVSTVK